MKSAVAKVCFVYFISCLVKHPLFHRFKIFTPLVDLPETQYQIIRIYGESQ